jgi:para-nitrobenzyl esterase
VPKVTWERGDHELSELMMQYWANFARSGNPNSRGLATWPRYEPQAGYPVMRLDVTSSAAPDRTRSRYEALDKAATPTP